MSNRFQDDSHDDDDNDDDNSINNAYRDCAVHSCVTHVWLICSIFAFTQAVWGGGNV